MKTKIPFVVMAKPAGSACNMRCRYCYYLNAPTEKTPESVMTGETLELFIRRYIEDSPGPLVSFTWHGGEPTLAGLSFFEEAVRLQRRYAPPSWQIWNNLQTNALLIDEHWCRFLKKHHFDVGVSIDGTAARHDAYRQGTDGSGTFERVSRSIALLQEHGVQPDLLCTVNAQTAAAPHEVYASLRSFHTGWIQFIPVFAPLPGPFSLPSLSAESVTSEAYNAFMTEVFRDWFFHDLGSLEIQLFSETTRLLAAQPPTLCTLSPVCGTVLVVEKDGSIYSCDHFVDSAHRLGHLSETGFQKVLQSEFQQNFGLRKKTSLPQKCRVCPYLSLCGGSCPKDRPSHIKSPALGCLRDFYEYAVPWLSLAMRLSAKGASPGEIMAHCSALSKSSRP